MSERFRYQPALDGLRAVAVALVLGFHLQVPHLTGGYLGVSVFFTLSGFLITQLLLSELADTGSVDIVHYLGRRARRLLPAGLLGLALVIGWSAADQFEPSRSLRRQIWAALLQVANWSDLLRGNSYTDLFSAPSPVAHYWSLAIEEQFYWFWPLALLVIVKAIHRRRPLPYLELVRLLVPIVGALFLIAAVSAPLTARWWSNDAAYLATWARSAEILSGAFLAVLSRRGVAIARLAPITLPALMAIVVIAVITPAGRGWAYGGGLPLFAVLTAVLLAGLQGESPARTLLSAPPLVWVGKISYGIYVFHWPMIVWLTPDRVGFGGFWLGLVRVVTAVALAVVSYRLVEQPVRLGEWFQRPRRVAPAAVGATVGVACVALLVPRPDAPLTEAPPVLIARSDSPASTVSVGPTTVAVSIGATAPATAGPTSSPGSASTTTSQPPPTVIAVLGDSVPAWLLRDAAPTYDRTDVVILNGSKEACDGYDGDVIGRDRHGRELAAPDACLGWPATYPTVLASGPRPARAALLVIGTLPVLDRRVDGVWHSPCDGIDWYLDDVGRRLDFLQQMGVQPIVAVPARPGKGADFVAPADVADRIACIRAQMFEFLRARAVATVDLDPILCPGGDCDGSRVDGVHVRPELAPAVLGQVLDAAVGLLDIP